MGETYHIPPQYLQDNTEFAVLLKDIETNILTNTITSELYDRMHKARMELDSTKHEYFKMLLLCTEITELVYDVTQKGNVISRKVFEFAGLSHGLPLLGIDSKALYPLYIGAESYEKELDGYLELRLSKKCALLAEFFEPHSLQSTDLQAARGLQLAQVTSTKTVQVESEQNKLALDTVNNTLVFWEYFFVLEKALFALGSMVTAHKEQQGHTENIVITKWLQERLQATQLKLQVLDCQFKDSIYTKVAKCALESIAIHLNTAATQVKQLYDRTFVRYQLFEAVGLGFNKLAHEYSTIVKDCAHKEWALRELQELGRE